MFGPGTDGERMLCRRLEQSLRLSREKQAKHEEEELQRKVEAVWDGWNEMDKESSSNFSNSSNSQSPMEVLANDNYAFFGSVSSDEIMLSRRLEQSIHLSQQAQNQSLLSHQKVDAFQSGRNEIDEESSSNSSSSQSLIEDETIETYVLLISDSSECHELQEPINTTDEPPFNLNETFDGENNPSPLKIEIHSLMGNKTNDETRKGHMEEMSTKELEDSKSACSMRRDTARPCSSLEPKEIIDELFSPSCFSSDDEAILTEMRGKETFPLIEKVPGDTSDNSDDETRKCTEEMMVTDQLDCRQMPTVEEKTSGFHSRKPSTNETDTTVSIKKKMPLPASLNTDENRKHREEVIIAVSMAEKETARTHSGMLSAHKPNSNPVATKGGKLPSISVETAFNDSHSSFENSFTPIHSGEQSAGESSTFRSTCGSIRQKTSLNSKEARLRFRSWSQKRSPSNHFLEQFETPSRNVTVTPTRSAYNLEPVSHVGVVERGNHVYHHK